MVIITFAFHPLLLPNAKTSGHEVSHKLDLQNEPPYETARELVQLIYLRNYTKYQLNITDLYA
jgi:hypothetical protein